MLLKYKYKACIKSNDIKFRKKYVLKISLQKIENLQNTILGPVRYLLMDSALEVLISNVLQTVCQSCFDLCQRLMAVSFVGVFTQGSSKKLDGQIGTVVGLSKHYGFVMGQIVIGYKAGLTQCIFYYATSKCHQYLCLYSVEPSLQSFQHFHVESTHDSLSLRYKFMVNSTHLDQKRHIEHDFKLQPSQTAAFERCFTPKQLLDH